MSKPFSSISPSCGQLSLFDSSAQETTSPVCTSKVVSSDVKPRTVCSGRVEGSTTPILPNFVYRHNNRQRHLPSPALLERYISIRLGLPHQWPQRTLSWIHGVWYDCYRGVEAPFDAAQDFIAQRRRDNPRYEGGYGALRKAIMQARAQATGVLAHRFSQYQDYLSERLFSKMGVDAESVEASDALEWLSEFYREYTPQEAGLTMETLLIEIAAEYTDDFAPEQKTL